MGVHTVTAQIVRMEVERGYKNEYVKRGGHITLTLVPEPNDGSEFRWRLTEEEACEYRVGQSLEVTLMEPEVRAAASRTKIAYWLNGTKVEYEPEDEIALVTYHMLVRQVYGASRQGASVVFHNGPEERREGSLLPNQFVRLVDGMVFDVAMTNQA